MRTIVKIGAAIIGIIWFATSDITPRKQETEYQSFEETKTVENYKEPAPSLRGRAYEVYPSIKNPTEIDSTYYEMELTPENGYQLGSEDAYKEYDLP